MPPQRIRFLARPTHKNLVRSERDFSTILGRPPRLAILQPRHRIRSAINLSTTQQPTRAVPISITHPNQFHRPTLQLINLAPQRRDSHRERDHTGRQPCMQRLQRQHIRLMSDQRQHRRDFLAESLHRCQALHRNRRPRTIGINHFKTSPKRAIWQDDEHHSRHLEWTTQRNTARQFDLTQHRKVDLATMPAISTSNIIGIKYSDASGASLDRLHARYPRSRRPRHFDSRPRHYGRELDDVRRR